MVHYPSYVEAPLVPLPKLYASEEYNFAMTPGNPDWYLIPLALVIAALILINEWGYGLIGYVLLMPVAFWLMAKAFGRWDSGE